MSVPTLKQAPVQENTRILGLGAYRPDIIVTNEDVCQWIDSSDEWIRQRTGIVTRHRAGPSDTTSAWRSPTRRVVAMQCFPLAS